MVNREINYLTTFSQIIGTTLGIKKCSVLHIKLGKMVDNIEEILALGTAAHQLGNAQIY